MNEEKKVKAIFNAVIVKPLEIQEGKYGNIVVPDLGKEKNEIGEILSVGPGQYSVTGEWLPTQLKRGQIVVLPTMGFTKLPYNGEDFYVGPENQILAVIE